MEHKNNNVIEFKKNEDSSGRKVISMPTIKEVDILKKISNSYSEDEMVDNVFWDGCSWKSIFEGLCTEWAQRNNLDPWDVLAVFITKLRGTQFIELNDGRIEVRTSGYEEE